MIGKCIIALEGVDGSGKTSTLNMLKKNSKIVVRSSMPKIFYSIKDHMDRNQDTVGKFLFFLNAIKMSLGKNVGNNYVFFDRYVPSLFAYNHVFNDLSIDQFKSFMSPFWDYIPKENMICLLYCSHEEMMIRISQKENKSFVENEILKNEDIINQLNNAYKLYYKKISFNSKLIEVDTTNVSCDVTAKLIIKALNL